VDYEGFLSLVEEQTPLGRPGLDRGEAIAATGAVLETLAERVNPGAVDDLMRGLPSPLHAPLQRGKAHYDRRPRDLPVEEFLDRVADREGVDRDHAVAHTVAVFAALREAVDERSLALLGLPDYAIPGCGRQPRGATLGSMNAGTPKEVA